MGVGVLELKFLSTEMEVFPQTQDKGSYNNDAPDRRPSHEYGAKFTHHWSASSSVNMLAYATQNPVGIIAKTTAAVLLGALQAVVKRKMCTCMQNCKSASAKAWVQHQHKKASWVAEGNTPADDKQDAAVLANFMIRFPCTQLGRAQIVRNMDRLFYGAVDHH